MDSLDGWITRIYNATSNQGKKSSAFAVFVLKED
jgi:phosphatidylserine synthase